MKVIITLTLLFIASMSLAQSNTVDFFGDDDQPGHRLHQDISDRISVGISEDEAIAASIMAALEQTATLVDAESKSALAFDLEHGNAFYKEMLFSNSLIEVVKVLSEAFPDKALHTIQLGVVLYPEYTQEVYDGAMLAGVMNSDDIFVALIQSGADPSSFADATAAGAPVAANVVVTNPPLGTGLGSGGAGGDEQTISVN